MTTSAPLRAAVLAVTAWQVVPLMDGIAKYLSNFYPIAQVVWARFFFHFLWVAPVVLFRYGPGGFKVDKPALQIARGAFLFLATVCFFTGIHYIPLADATAIVFVAPLIVLIFSAIWLKERIGWLQIVGVIAGFIGMLIILRPGFQGFHWASTLLLFTAVGFAAFIVSTRALAGSAPPVVTLAYQSILGLVVTTLAIPWFWVMPGPTDWVLMIAIGAIAATGHLLLIKAHELGAASQLAPFSYTEIIMALIVGYLVFGDFPDQWTWLGMAVIIGSSLYVTWPQINRSG